jgi:hypothetical protein
MSLDKVLNRPLFRQQALRKGALKPIQARIGTMVGLPTGGSLAYNPMRVPAINQQGFYGRNIRPAIQRARQNVLGVKPGQSYFKTLGRDMKNLPGSFGSQIMKPRTSVPFGLGGGLGRVLGFEGIYSGVSNTTDKLGMKPGALKTVVDLAGSTALAFNPYARAAGLAYSGYKMGRAGLGALYDKFSGQPIGTTREALTMDMGEPLNVLAPIDTSKPKGRGATKKALEERKKLAQAEGSEVGIIQPDALKEPQNETEIGQTKVADLNKLVKNKRGEILKETIPVQTVAQVTEQPSGIDGGLEGPVGAEPGAPMGAKPPAPVQEPKPLQTAQRIYNSSQDGKGTEKPIGGKLFTTDLVNRAKQIRSELGMDPQGDLARTTFLSQLAAGLLSGTTRKSGIGGALEVFGQALGPAVNNYAVMKLKQNELENKSMETYLGYALDEMKLFNEAAAGEPFGGELGVVQFIDDAGNTINVKGRQTKGGTIEFATGQVGPRGNEIYAPISSQSNVPGFGQVNQFLDKKTVDKETIKIGDTLSNRYKTFKITNDVLDTIALKPKTVGPGGAINLFKTRFGSALNDLGFSFGGSKDQARATAEAYRSQIENSDLDEETKKELLNKMNFKKIYNNAVGRVKSRAGDEKITPEDLESLAVAETTLVYALANSFKDKDRLTARDVAAAEKLVNLFTLTRGSRSVEASIRAIGQQLQDDIIRYENDYRRVGGLERTLQNMRIQNEFRLQEGQTVTDTFIKSLDDAGLLKEFNK